jgi:hypothetical protein
VYNQVANRVCLSPHSSTETNLISTLDASLLYEKNDVDAKHFLQLGEGMNTREMERWNELNM